MERLRVDVSVQYDTENPHAEYELTPDSDGGIVRYTDAQATIATLQAQLDERLEFIKDCDVALDRIQAPRTNDGQEELVSTWRRIELVGSLLSQYRSTLEQMSTQLTQRTAECDALKLVNDTHMKTVMKLSHVVEQRTAELEAVQQQLLSAQETILRTYTASAALDLVGVKAELERVRGQFADLRKMVAALPKVEGEIEVSSGVYNFILLKHDSGTRFLCGQIETEQTAKAIAALWQHRQGMEG